jgi:Reverse transcriptase (RNA-dependent DNA polymerase)
MKELGFVQLKSDYCIFKREQPLTFVVLYVDDIIPITESNEVMQQLKGSLMQKFQMKDMGPLHQILGISCIQDEEHCKLGLTQEAYIDKLLNKYSLAWPVSTPSDTNVVLMKSDEVSQPVEKSLYQSMVGSLMYVALATRPDIQFAISNVAKYSTNPDQSHLTVVKRIFRYLIKLKTMSYGMVKAIP